MTNLSFFGVNTNWPRPTPSQHLDGGVGGDLYGSNYSDLNNDGLYDYVVLSGQVWTETPSEETSLGVFLNTGPGGFQYQAGVIDDHLGGLHPRKLEIADLNNDGIKDFVVADHGYDLPPFPGAEPRVFLSNNGQLLWSDETALFDGIKGFHHAVSISDFNSDGFNDLFFTDTGIFLNSAGTDFRLDNSAIANTTILSNPNYTSEISDVDSDGYADLVVAGHEFQGAETKIYWGSSSGDFNEDNTTALPSISGHGVVVDIDIADFNRDGVNEILLNRAGSPPINSFYEGGAKLQMLEMRDRTDFRDISSEVFPRLLSEYFRYGSGESINWVTWLRPADLDNDGDIDLFVDDPYLSTEYNALLNNGTGKFLFGDLVKNGRVGIGELAVALDITGANSAGAGYRLYKAAFDRTPDEEGLGYWINELDQGFALHEVANSFVISQEFKNLYGADLNNEGFITALYNNVLDRDPDQGGLDYWINDMENNGMSRADVLASFSESAENIANTDPLIELGVVYQPYGDVLLG